MKYLQLQTSTFITNNYYAINYIQAKCSIQNISTLKYFDDNGNWSSNEYFFNYENYLLYTNNKYLIINKNKEITLTEKKIQTYFISHEPNHDIFEQIKNRNINIEFIYDHINTTFYFIVNEEYNNIFLLSLKQEIIQYYFNLGLDIDYSNKQGHNILMIACIYNSSKLINHIIKYFQSRNEINIQDKRGYTALMHAFINYNYKAVKIFIQRLNILSNEEILKYVNIQNSSGNTILMIACKYGYTNVLKLIIYTMKNLTLYHNQLLHYLNIQNNRGETALMIAYKYGFIHIVRRLLREFNENCLKYLSLQDNNGNTILIHAAKHNDGDIIDYIISKVTTCKNKKLKFINIQNNEGDSALMCAAKLNNKKAKETLIYSMRYIADKNKLFDYINVQNNDGVSTIDLLSKYDMALLSGRI